MENNIYPQNISLIYLSYLIVKVMVYSREYRQLKGDIMQIQLFGLFSHVTRLHPPQKQT